MGPLWDPSGTPPGDSPGDPSGTPPGPHLGPLWGPLLGPLWEPILPGFLGSRWSMGDTPPDPRSVVPQTPLLLEKPLTCNAYYTVLAPDQGFSCAQESQSLSFKTPRGIIFNS